MSGNDVPSQLPRPKDDDAEDVAWALSTAEALWKRGERADAIGWIRKAAAAAADVDADLRVLELAKAAAELTAIVEASAEPTAEIDLHESSIEIELDDSLAESAPPRKPPPPRAPAATRVPTPNPFPSPLREVPIEEIPVDDAPPVEEEVPRPSAAAVEETEHHESQPRIPTVPPPAPENGSASQMDMRPVAAPRAVKEPRVSTIPSHPPPPPSVPRPASQPPKPSDAAGVTSAVLEAARPLTTRPRPSSMRAAVPPDEPLELEDIPAPPPAVPRPQSRPAPAIVASEPRLKVPRAPAVPIITTAELESIDALEDIPDDARASLIDAARVIALAADQAVPAPSAVLVISGEIEVRSTRHAVRIDLIEQGQIRMLAPIPPADSELVIVGGPSGARVMAIEADRVDRLRKLAPWVVDELVPGSDDVHVVAGALRGKLGARLEPQVLEEILDCTDVVRLAPSVVVVKSGEPVRALVVVGAGELALRGGDGAAIGRVVAGDVVFPRELATQAPAPAQVRAGPNGALLLVATRASTQELLARADALVELLREG